MTIQQIQARIERIKDARWDDEAAHSAEDRLREDFIRHVQSCDDPQLAVMAALVLTTNEIEFARWCA